MVIFRSLLRLGFNQDTSTAKVTSGSADAANPERTSWMLINHWAGNLDSSGCPPGPRVSPPLLRSGDFQLAEKPSLGCLDMSGPGQTAQTAEQI